MSYSEEIVKKIRAIAGYDDLLYESAICTVSDVDAVANTCTCTPIDGSAKFIDVQLSMDKSKGFLLIPSNGSTVVVTQINDSDAFISMVSDVDNIYLNGDGEDGLVKVNDLVTKLNNSENKINAILTFLAGLGATPPLTTPLVPTVKADLENTKVKQG